MMVLRSMLYVPGNNVRMIAKAAGLPADAIILDLEDSVSLLDKETARIVTRDSIKAIRCGRFLVFVRVNALATGLTADDLEAVIVNGLDGVMLAKAETKQDIATLDSMIEQAGRAARSEANNLSIIPLVESATGIINAHEIALASERVVAVAFGAGDYYRDLGRSISFLSPDGFELLYARSHLVNASRAAGVQAIDAPFLGLLGDKDGLARETRRALQLGFKGKQVIHPAHIAIVNDTFSPSQEEVQYASRLADAFEEAKARGLGTISFEGRMIDYMSYKQATDLVNFARAIDEKQGGRQTASYINLSGFFVSTPKGPT